MITGRQIREGRRLAGLRRHQLSVAAKIVTTVKLARVETSDGEADLTDRQVAAIRRVLQAAGVEFIVTSDEGPGVRLRKGERES